MITDNGSRPEEIHRPLVDVRDMIVVHTAMLREFRLVTQAVAGVPAGSSKRAAIVDGHLRFVCDLLHHHHEGEDELLWPKLRARVTPSALTLIDAVEAQHAQLDVALDRVAAARSAWTRDPGVAQRDALVTELRTLQKLLGDHLELEERSLLPLAAAVLTEAEWNQVGEAGAAALPKSKLPLVFGMFSYEGDPAVVASMLSAAPALPRLLMPHIAPRAYARLASRVYGTSRP